MSRQLLSINQSLIRSPVLAPIHSALSGNPSAGPQYVWLATISINCPLPVFKILYNTKSFTVGNPVASADWYMQSYRYFRSRNVSVVNTRAGGNSGTVDDSMAASTFYPSTARSGTFFGLFGSYDTIFNHVSFRADAVGVGNEPGGTTGAWDTRNETSVQWTYDPGDGLGTIVNSENRTNEYTDWATDIGRCLTFLAAVDFTTATGIWNAAPSDPQYNSWIYRALRILVTNYGPAPLPGANYYWPDQLSEIDTSALAAYMTAHSAITVDNAIYPVPGVVSEPAPSAVAAYPDNLIACCIASLATPGGINSSYINTTRSQVKFNFVTPYVIFEAGTSGGTAGNNNATLIKLVSTGTSVANTIIDIPVPSSAASLPFKSNSHAISQFTTFVLFGDTWANLQSTIWPNAVVVGAW